MKVRWNRLKDDFLLNLFQTVSRRAKNPYQIGLSWCRRGDLNAPDQELCSHHPIVVDRCDISLLN